MLNDTFMPVSSVVMDSESATESADLRKSVQVRIREFFCGRKGRFWVVCSRVNIYSDGTIYRIVSIIAILRSYRGIS